VRRPASDDTKLVRVGATATVIRVGVLAGILASATVIERPVEATPAVLITEEEAAMAPPVDPREPEVLPREGPIIHVVSPSEPVVTSPFDIDVRFSPREGGPPVLMASLRVVLVKFISIDITERVRPYVDGTRLLVSQAQIPRGRHRLRIRIADREGGVTADILEITVR
jgi:hypothetical protein